MPVSLDCNFAFLEEDFPHLAHNACIAEACLYTDPHNSIIKIGVLNEEICRIICLKSEIEVGKKDKLAQIIHKLKKHFFTDEEAEIYLAIEKIAKSRNMAAHNLPRNEKAYSDYIQIAQNTLEAGYSISSNFFCRFVDPDYRIPDFHMPARKMMDENDMMDFGKDAEFNMNKEFEALREEALQDAREFMEEEAELNSTSTSIEKQTGINNGVVSGIATGAAIALGPLGLPLLACALPIIPGLVAKGAIIGGATALGAKALGKGTGILPDPVKKFFQSLDLSDIDSD